MLKAVKRLAWRAIEAAKIDRRSIAGNLPAFEANGWLRSRDEGRCVDAAGNPIPWIAYPAVSFISRRARPEMIVFEYGSGASTLWWASRVRHVYSVEHDRRFYSELLPRLPANATLAYAELGPDGAYAESVLAPGVAFDVVVIDGRDRVRCVPQAVRALKPDGVILFDNADRPDYEAGYRALGDAGFRKIE